VESVDKSETTHALILSSSPIVIFRFLRSSIAMDFEPVSQTEENDLNRREYDGHWYKRRRRDSYVLVGLTTTTLVSVLLLLFLFMARGTQPVMMKDERLFRSARYGENHSRMSLDHKYDYLWTDLTVDDFGLVPSTDNGADNTAAYAALSMCVHASSRSRLTVVPPQVGPS
jgi:hypothetical protein